LYLVKQESVRPYPDLSEGYQQVLCLGFNDGRSQSGCSPGRGWEGGRAGGPWPGDPQQSRLLGSAGTWQCPCPPAPSHTSVTQCEAMPGPTRPWRWLSGCWPGLSL